MVVGIRWTLDLVWIWFGFGLFGVWGLSLPPEVCMILGMSTIGLEDDKLPGRERKGVGITPYTVGKVVTVRSTPGGLPRFHSTISIFLFP